jgi:hypothetical protein
MIAGINTKDPAVSAAVLGFMLIGLVATLPYKQWVHRKSRATAQSEGGA